MQVAGEAVALVGDREPGVLLAGLQQVEVARISWLTPHIANAAVHDREGQPRRLDQPGDAWPETCDRDRQHDSERQRRTAGRHITPTTAT